MYYFILQRPDNCKHKSKLLNSDVKVDIFLWLGLKRQIQTCLSMLPPGYATPEKNDEIGIHVSLLKHISKEDEKKGIDIHLPLHIRYKKLIVSSFFYK